MLFRSVMGGEQGYRIIGSRNRGMSPFEGANYVNGDYWVEQVDDMVYIHFSSFAFTENKTGPTIESNFNVPAKFRPQTTVEGVVWSPNTNNNLRIAVFIDGSIHLHNLPSTTTINANIKLQPQTLCYPLYCRQND